MTPWFNALGYYNGFLYATITTGSSAGQIIQIGQGGVYTTVGISLGASYLNSGDVDPDTGTMYVAYPNGANSTKLYIINLNTKSWTTKTLSAQLPNVSDFVFQDGLLYGAGSDQKVYTINPTSGAVTAVATIPGGSTSQYGAAWALGNGAIIFVQNATGSSYRYDPASGELLKFTGSNSTITSAGLDGASIRGSAVDLALTKTGLKTYVAGKQLTYALTVTNSGTTTASGGLVRDTLPSGTTFASSDGNCTASGQDVICRFGTMAAAATTTINLTVDVEAGTTGDLTNQASVEANEVDSNSANDAAAWTSVVAVGGLKLVKSVSPTTYSAGDTLTYTFVLTNTGDLDLSEVNIADDASSFTGSGTLSGLTCDVALPATMATAGDPVTCTADYVATASDVAAGELTNTAVATATDSTGGTLSLSGTAAAAAAITPTPSPTSTPVVKDVEADDGDVSANTGVPTDGEPNWLLIALGAVFILAAGTVGVYRLRQRT